MTQVSIDRAERRSWFVHESGQRWTTAIARFAPELMPQPLVPAIVRHKTPLALIDNLTKQQDQSLVVIWESEGDSILSVCESLIHAARVCPGALQLVASSGRPNREQIILLELPCAGVIRHPEDLFKLRSMIQIYFQGSDNREQSRLCSGS